MKKTISIFIITLFLSCSTDLSNSNNYPEIQITKIGSDSTFEIGTWNILFFPVNGNTTITTVKEIIKGMDLDLIAVQEISDTNSFTNMLNDLPEWNGFFSND